jgi:hypothetical protein
MLLRRAQAPRSFDRAPATALRSALLRGVLVVVLLAALFGLGLATRIVAALEVAPAARRAAHVPVLLLPFLPLVGLHLP